MAIVARIVKVNDTSSMIEKAHQRFSGNIVAGVETVLVLDVGAQDIPSINVCPAINFDVSLANIIHGSNQAVA